jgi:hypothetical protein
MGREVDEVARLTRGPRGARRNREGTAAGPGGAGHGRTGDTQPHAQAEPEVTGRKAGPRPPRQSATRAFDPPQRDLHARVPWPEFGDPVAEKLEIRADKAWEGHVLGSRRPGSRPANALRQSAMYALEPPQRDSHARVSWLKPGDPEVDKLEIELVDPGRATCP